MIETTYALLADLVDKVRIGVPVIGVLATISDALQSHPRTHDQISDSIPIVPLPSLLSPSIEQQ